MDVNEKLMFLWKFKKKKLFIFFGGGGRGRVGGQGSCERFCENSIKK